MHLCVVWECAASESSSMCVSESSCDSVCVCEGGKETNEEYICMCVNPWRWVTKYIYSRAILSCMNLYLNATLNLNSTTFQTPLHSFLLHSYQLWSVLKILCLHTINCNSQISCSNLFFYRLLSEKSDIWILKTKFRYIFEGANMYFLFFSFLSFTSSTFN